MVCAYISAHVLGLAACSRIRYACDLTANPLRDDNLRPAMEKGRSDSGTEAQRPQGQRAALADFSHGAAGH
eukprot:11864815-Heterocapsa_arctica.AAC.1